MSRKHQNELSYNQLTKIKSGLDFVFWTFALLLVSTVFSGLIGSYFGNILSLFAAIPPALGMIGVMSIRSVITEVMGNASEQGSEIMSIKQTEVDTTSPEPETRPIAILSPVNKIKIEVEKKEKDKNREAEHEPSHPSIFENIDWEQWVGQKLLQKTGILIVLIGMIVFLKYSFDNRIIGELGRIALSAIGAIALLGTGEWFNKKYASWSHAFTGGGLALLYFTVWAAHVFYHQELLEIHGIELTPLVAMILYSFITLVGALAAIRYKAQAIAWFTVLGGYLTPFFIDTPTPSAIGLTIYLGILAAGILTLAWNKKWPYISLAAFILSQFYLFNAVYSSVEVSNTKQLLISIGFFVIFALPPILSQFKQKRMTEPPEICLILADGACTFFAIITALGGLGGSYVGLVLLLLATVYIVLSAAALRSREDDSVLVNTYLLSSIGLIALAIFAQLKTEWVGAGWAPYSVLLLFMSKKTQRQSIFACAVAMLMGSLFFLLINVPGLQGPSEALWHPFTSHWALLSYVIFASILSWMQLAKKLPPSFSTQSIIPHLHTIIALLVFTGLTFEITKLQWSFTLSLALAYLGFCALAVTLFAYTRMIIWFVAACFAQGIVILFTFLLSKKSGMVTPLLNGSDVIPFFHPWALVSVASLAIIVSIFVVARKSTEEIFKVPEFKHLMFGICAVQVWIHGSVEIQHMEAAYNWVPYFTHRILSIWWIIFASFFVYRGLKEKKVGIIRTGIIALSIPFIKDELLMLSGLTTLYELSLWTVLPLILAGISAKKNVKEFVRFAALMLGLIMASDMLHTIAKDTNLLRTIWWAIVGLLTISIGFKVREKILRHLAIGIFTATVIKLLVFDFATLSTGIRIAASILTGLLLIGASYLYQRFDKITH